MSFLLTGKGGRRYQWVAPIDPADVVFAGLGLWPENGDQYRDDGPGELHAVLEGTGLDTAWNQTNDLNRWQVTGDGVGRYVRIPYSAALDVPEFTISVWVTYYDDLRTYFWGRDNNTIRLYHLGRGYPMSQLYVRMWDSAGNEWGYYSPAGVIAVGVPLHVALTFRAGEQIVYANGKTLATGTLPNGARTGAVDATILRMMAGGGYMNGAVADPIMLSKAASPEQIAWLADPANRPVRPWRRRGLPSGAVPQVAMPDPVATEWVATAPTLVKSYSASPVVAEWVTIAPSTSARPRIPPERLLRVGHESRVLRVAAEDRVLRVAHESRTLKV